jgi:hypothetical protein
MMNAVNDDTEGTVFVMLTNTGNGLVEIRINQTRHRQKKMPF